MARILKSKPVMWSTLPNLVYQFKEMPVMSMPKHIRHSESMVEGIHTSAKRRAEVMVAVMNEKHKTFMRKLGHVLMPDEEYISRREQLLDNPILQNLGHTINVNQLMMLLNSGHHWK